MNIFGFLFFPVWIIIIVLLFLFFIFIFWLWAIIDCLSSRLSTAEKLFWVIVIIFFNLIGALLYFIFSKIKMVRIMKTKNIKGKRLLRSKKNRVIGGVCGGIGEYFAVDPTVIRLLWVVFTLFTGIFLGVLAYIIAWIIIPEGK